MLSKQASLIPTTLKALENHLEAVTNRMKRFNGMRASVFTSMKRMPLRERLSTLHTRRKLIANIPIITRELMGFRVWILDYQIARKMAFIIGQLDSDPGAQGRWYHRLGQFIGRAATYGGGRKIDYPNRQRLTALLEDLRRQVMRVDDADVKDEEEQVKMARTRRALTVARTKWLVVERLSMELTLKRVLAHGLLLQQQVLRGFRDLGYSPGLSELPPDID
ncbi:hypothetical protein F5Y09DRAFT_338965 [Xylaria sp. FL1042]|nr:hypothetical protein F5Y09DRAFT_338965 [Xylaria sp. FL1042]